MLISRKWFLLSLLASFTFSCNVHCGLYYGQTVDSIPLPTEAILANFESCYSDIKKDKQAIGLPYSVRVAMIGYLLRYACAGHVPIDGRKYPHSDTVIQQLEQKLNNGVSGNARAKDLSLQQLSETESTINNHFWKDKKSDLTNSLPKAAPELWMHVSFDDDETFFNFFSELVAKSDTKEPYLRKYSILFVVYKNCATFYNLLFNSPQTGNMMDSTVDTTYKYIICGAFRSLHDDIFNPLDQFLKSQGLPYCIFKEATISAEPLFTVLQTMFMAEIIIPEALMLSPANQHLSDSPSAVITLYRKKIHDCLATINLTHADTSTGVVAREISQAIKQQTPPFLSVWLFSNSGYRSILNQVLAFCPNEPELCLGTLLHDCLTNIKGEWIGPTLQEWTRKEKAETKRHEVAARLEPFCSFLDDYSFNHFAFREKMLVQSMLNGLASYVITAEACKTLVTELKNKEVQLGSSIIYSDGGRTIFDALNRRLNDSPQTIKRLIYALANHDDLLHLLEHLKTCPVFTKNYKRRE